MKSRTLLERFEEKVIKREGCWSWIGAKDKGYGKIHDGYTEAGNKRCRSASRVSYELFVGKIPKGLCVCHKCDNPECNNPEHLFVGTHRQNM